MNKIASRNRVLALLLAGSLLTGATACSVEAKDLRFLEEWASIKDVDPRTTSGAWNIGKRAFGGSTGDERRDALIDVGEVVKAIKEADEKMDEGKKAQAEGDLKTAAKKMDEAIKKPAVS